MNSNCFAIYFQQRSSYVCSDIYFSGKSECIFYSSQYWFPKVHSIESDRLEQFEQMFILILTDLLKR